MGCIHLLFLFFIINKISANPTADELVDSVKLVREQVSALLNNRQQDYNALEESLKSAIEKNTELIVLKNEVKQLR